MHKVRYASFPTSYAYFVNDPQLPVDVDYVRIILNIAFWFVLRNKDLALLNESDKVTYK